MPLYAAPQDVYQYRNKRLKLNMSFDTVLKVFDLQKEDIFSDSDKINLSLELLIRNYRVIKGLSIQDKTRILDEIYRNVIFPERKKSSGDNKKVFDFREDEEYIFASFMSCYGMDLYQMCGKLHWKKFMALFKGLTDDTKIKEVMSIRSREIPAPTKYNQKEIQSLRELKAYYALGKVEENYRDGLNALFNTLERMAKRK